MFGKLTVWQKLRLLAYARTDAKKTKESCGARIELLCQEAQLAAANALARAPVLYVYGTPQGKMRLRTGTFAAAVSRLLENSRQLTEQLQRQKLLHEQERRLLQSEAARAAEGLTAPHIEAMYAKRLAALQKQQAETEKTLEDAAARLLRHREQLLGRQVVRLQLSRHRLDLALHYYKAALLRGGGGVEIPAQLPVPGQQLLLQLAAEAQPLSERKSVNRLYPGRAAGEVIHLQSAGS
ncbi:MAG: hypothetical protein IJ412_02595 [Oscillospiraceae bacterium]|nr:hypothetical protein [Oscillospiraceae bacterium]